MITFAAGVPGDRADHIFVMGLDGSSKQQLTNVDANDMDPEFSPEGNQVVFTRDKTYGWGGLAANWNVTGVICVVNIDGTGEIQLTPNDWNAHSPSFSIDGSKVHFFTPEGRFTIKSDGSGKPIKIGELTSGRFSNDQKAIVYSDGKYSPDHEIFISNADESNRKQLTNSKNGCFNGIFNNNKTKIYFTMEEWPNGFSGHPKSSLWSVNSDGTNQIQITNLDMFDSPSKWKPKNTP